MPRSIQISVSVYTVEIGQVSTVYTSLLVLEQILLAYFLLDLETMPTATSLSPSRKALGCATQSVRNI